MTLYRALYLSRTGRSRRFTFAHAGGLTGARAFAREWELRDDRLVSVALVRQLARPLFALRSN